MVAGQRCGVTSEDQASIGIIAGLEVAGLIGGMIGIAVGAPQGCPPNT